jgi:hypothetical protein
MSFTTRGKFRATLAVVMLVGFAIIALWAATNRNWVAYLVFVWVFAGTWVIAQVKCPRCGAPVAYNVRVGKIRILSAFSRRQCGECGQAFNQ